MRKVIGLGLVTLAVLAGCAAPAGQEESPSDDGATGTDDVVGITDLATLERSFGLTLATAQNRGDTNALRAGSCYRALIGAGSTSFEFRRYVNGAAFWAKKGSGYNSGNERPVLCLDLNRPEVSTSLSGVALDAALRYDLGKVIGEDSGMQKTYIEFERGTIQLSRYDVTDAELLASVQRRPHELPFENASTISGRLSAIRIKNVAITSQVGGGTSTNDIEIDGQAAHFIYRFAWRKGEDTGRFMLAEDAVGAFKKTANMEGDGPGMVSVWHFAKGDVSASSFGNYDGNGPETTDEDIVFRAAGAPADRAPAAECKRTKTAREAPPPYSCTGI